MSKVYHEPDSRVTLHREFVGASSLLLDCEVGVDSSVPGGNESLAPDSMLFLEVRVIGTCNVTSFHVVRRIGGGAYGMVVEATCTARFHPLPEKRYALKGIGAMPRGCVLAQAN